MTAYVIDPPTPASLAIEGHTARYPVNRIFCVGRNYAAHAAEMGNTVDRSAPFYFTKSAVHLAPSGVALPYPPGTSDYHHEVECVVALGAPLFQASPDTVMEAVFGYAVGLDMTRRDLQARAKDKRHPWDVAKDLEGGAVVAPLVPRAQFGDLADQEITLTVNGELRQQGRLCDMVWSVPELLAHLSGLYHLQPGDLIMTGTPSGVGPVVAGDVLTGTLTGAPLVHLTLGAAE